MALKTYVTINGINVTSYISGWNIPDEIDDIMTIANVRLTKNVIDVVEPEQGQELIIKRGNTTGQENTMFRGLIEITRKVHPFITVNAKDGLYALQKEEVTHSYDKNVDASAGVPSEIFLDLINTRSTLTATSSTVQDSSTLELGIILNKFVCNHDTIFDRCKFLAEILNWQFYYNSSDNLVYFEPRGYTEYGTTLVTGKHIISGVPEWKFDNSMCINKVIILGARQLVETTQLFSGDAAETEFQLDNVPESIKVFVGSILQTGGITRSTTTFDYSVDINPDVRKVIFESGSVPGSGSDNIEVRYSYSVPVPVTGENSESIEKYGKYEKTLVYEDIKSVDDAEEKARQTLSKFSTPFASTQLKIIDATDIKAGYLVNVQDDINNESRTLLVKKIVYNYPFTGDEITLSDREWRLETWLIGMDERLKKIEREMTRNQDYLVHLRDLNHTMDYNRRYTEVFTRDTTNDSIYNRDGTVYGTSTYSDTYDQSLVTVRLVWPNQIVKETFLDTTFKDVSQTDANWDTTLNRVSID